MLHYFSMLSMKAKKRCPKPKLDIWSNTCSNQKYTSFVILLLLISLILFVGAASSLSSSSSSSSPSSNTHNASKIVAAATTVTVATEITSKQDIAMQDDTDMDRIQRKKRGRTNKEDVDEDKRRKKKAAMYLRTTSKDVEYETSSLAPAMIGPFSSPRMRDNEEASVSYGDDNEVVRGRKRTSLERDEEDKTPSNVSNNYEGDIDSMEAEDENARVHVEDEAKKKRDIRLAQRRDLYAKNKKKDKPWNEEEETLFEDVVKTFSGWGDWASVACNIPSRTKKQVEAYAQKLSETCPAKVHQLINEHENYINKLSKDWDAQISQAAQSLLVNYDASRVSNYTASEALVRAGVSSNLTCLPCMKKFVVNKMTSLAANGRQPIYNTPNRKRNRNTVDGHRQPIDRVSEALKCINRTSTPAPVPNPEEVAPDQEEPPDVLYHQALVCICCDCHIIGTEQVCHLRKDQLEKNKDRIGVESYNEYYMNLGYDELHPELVKQYQVDGLPGLLLSQRSRHTNKGYMACLSCYDSLTTKSQTKSPPKRAIANGFVIGRIPSVLRFKEEDGTTREWEVNYEKDITDILRAMLAPTRAYGYTFVYFAGAQKSIQGHYTFYEVDQNHVGSVINAYQNTGANPYIYVVYGGRLTPNQKKIIEKKTELKTDVYTDFMTWFIQQSGHRGFDGITIPAECPQPEIVGDTDSNVDIQMNPRVEEQFDGGTYYFSSAHSPSEDTGTYKTQAEFTKTLLNRAPPTLLVSGGAYKSGRDLLLEDILPVAFPFGLGGPSMPRRTNVGIESCLAHYGRLANPEFMRGDFQLIAKSMLDRHLSFTSAKVKCRAVIDGTPLAEKVSQLTIKDLEEVADQGEDYTGPASSFLKQVSSSCKAMGQTTEAAKDARRTILALSDRYGMNTCMLTVTPNDEMSVGVRLYAMPGDKLKIPSLNATEDDCIADFKLRKTTRLDFPGACSLNYQSVLQIVEEILLGWDPKTQKGSPDGVLDEIEAYSRADEEQNRKTLHGHYLIWVKGFSDIRDALFDNDADKREAARAKFYEYINKIMCASYYKNKDWIIEHECNGETKKAKVEDVYQERGPQILRDARHQEDCHEVNGKIMECTSCGEEVSTQEIINMALREWHQNAVRDKQTSAESDLEFPLRNERLAIAAYRWPFDKDNGKLSDDTFWGNDDVRSILQISAENEHRALHGPRCFKKGNECTSGSFPQAYCPDTCIHEDLSGGQEELHIRHLLNGSKTHSPPWMILPKRPLGCQYLNTHNPIISGVISSNTNVLMGDISQAFYTTLYSSKSTQKEDREKYVTIGKKLTRRMKRLEMERQTNPDEYEEDENGQFVNGLGMMLSAMIANTSRDVVSSTMSHLLVAQKGKRFTFSHEPKHLLLTQLEAQLDNDDEVQFTLRRTNRSTNEGKVVQWPDSSANDYLDRPVELEDCCAYYYTERYEKKFFAWKEMDNDEEDTVVSRSHGYRFPTKHPGHEFAYMHPLKVPAVVVVSYPEGKLCLLKELELTSDNPSQLAQEKREDYAKVALMMFYPFRTLDDLLTNGSYWTTFDRERKGYFSGTKTVFWAEGFKILQNIEDRMSIQLSKSRVRARDPVQLRSVVKSDDKEKKKKKNDGDQAPDISFYDDSDDESYDDSDMEDGEKYADRDRRTHDHLVNRLKKVRVKDKCISARITSLDASLIQTDDESTTSNAHGGDDGNNSQEGEMNTNSYYENRDYPTLIKLITGSLIGGSASYDDIYENGEDIIPVDNDEGEDKIAGSGVDVDYNIPTVTQDDSMQNEQATSVPTLVGVARKVARREGTKLDEKQYIAYEIIACTFLLQLVYEGRDGTSILGEYLGSALNTGRKEDMDRLVEHLKARGGMDQLIMFLTGPAGAGKSTAVQVAQKFCFDFCRTVGTMWNDKEFYFTACSGSAAAIFGGTTIHSAAYLNARKVTDKARGEWKSVRILIIDEVSYFCDADLNKLDRRLKDLKGHPNKIFGGQSIIFSGDFRQFEAIMAKYLLFDRNGSQLWENSINCAIILENRHRFKDDPDYGDLLTRFWSGDLTEDDRKLLNTRVVGRNGLKLPSKFDGSVTYACALNIERNVYQAGIFRNHITQTHPPVDSPDLPPNNTIIIEAAIQKSKGKSKHTTSIGSYTRDRIINTCGDADCKVNESKFVDPALRLYVGALCMCTVDNSHLKDEVPIGNGTLCRVVGMKLTEHAPSHRWKNWDGRKVWTVCAKHVEWVEFEYYPNPKSSEIEKLEGEIKEKDWELDIHKESPELLEIINKDLVKLRARLKKIHQSTRFKLKPITTSPTVSFSLHDKVNEKFLAKCRMTQIPVILADAITGHKTQGMTFHYVIIPSWGNQNNWAYVVLSRCRTLKGLFLFKPISMEKSFAPSRDLKEYLVRAKALQDRILQTRRERMAALGLGP